jgi:hypothetical protein
MTGLCTAHLTRSTRMDVKGTYTVRAADGEIFPGNFSKDESDLIVDTLNGAGDADRLEAWAATKGSMLEYRLGDHLKRLRAVST